MPIHGKNGNGKKGNWKKGQLTEETATYGQTATKIGQTENNGSGKKGYRKNGNGKNGQQKIGNGKIRQWKMTG